MIIIIIISMIIIVVIKIHHHHRSSRLTSFALTPRAPKQGQNNAKRTLKQAFPELALERPISQKSSITLRQASPTSIPAAQRRRRIGIKRKRNNKKYQAPEQPLAFSPYGHGSKKRFQVLLRSLRADSEGHGHTPSIPVRSDS